MKKQLNSIVILSFLLTGGMLMSSCNKKSFDGEVSKESTDSSTNTSGQTIESDTILDSQNNDAIILIKNQVDDLNSRFSDLKTKISRTDSTIADLKGSLSLSIIISWIVATISLIIAIFALIKSRASIAYSGKNRQKIKELKQLINESETRFENISRNTSISTSRMSSNEYADLSSRVYRIERHLQNQSQQKQPEQERNITTYSQSSLYREQNGYFGLPVKKSATEAYFKSLEDSYSPEARFSVTVVKDRAVFSPLKGDQYLNDLRSSDTIKFALDIKSYDITKATQMKEIRSGEATKIGDRWEITKKAIIEFMFRKLMIS